MFTLLFVIDFNSRSNLMDRKNIVAIHLNDLVTINTTVIAPIWNLWLWWLMGVSTIIMCENYRRFCRIWPNQANKILFEKNLSVVPAWSLAKANEEWEKEKNERWNKTKIVTQPIWSLKCIGSIKSNWRLDEGKNTQFSPFIHVSNEWVRKGFRLM